ncbi:MAG: hypothetical protein K0B08_01850 [Bacteroidales bacterium]|nr:hypothetical protein [Bacteroidales bacterium]
MWLKSNEFDSYRNGLGKYLHLFHSHYLRTPVNSAEFIFFLENFYADLPDEYLKFILETSLKHSSRIIFSSENDTTVIVLFSPGLSCIDSALSNSPAIKAIDDVSIPDILFRNNSIFNLTEYDFPEFCYSYFHSYRVFLDNIPYFSYPGIDESIDAFVSTLIHNFYNDLSLEISQKPISNDTLQVVLKFLVKLLPAGSGFLSEFTCYNFKKESEFHRFRNYFNSGISNLSIEPKPDSIYLPVFVSHNTKTGMLNIHTYTKHSEYIH